MDLLTNAARANKKSLPEGELVEKALDKVLSMFVEFLTEGDLPRVVLQKVYSKYFRKIHRKHLKTCKLIKNILRQRFFLWALWNFSEQLFYKKPVNGCFWRDRRENRMEMLIFTINLFLVSFYTPWKHQKTYAILMFSRSLERDQWHEMGQQEFYFSFLVTLRSTKFV